MTEKSKQKIEKELSGYLSEIEEKLGYSLEDKSFVYETNLIKSMLFAKKAYRRYSSIIKAAFLSSARDMDGKTTLCRAVVFPEHTRKHEIGHVYQHNLNRELKQLSYNEIVEKLKKSTGLEEKTIENIFSETSKLPYRTYLEGFANFARDMLGNDGKKTLGKIYSSVCYRLLMKKKEREQYEKGLEFYREIKRDYGTAGVLVASAFGSVGKHLSKNELSEYLADIERTLGYSLEDKSFVYETNLFKFMKYAWNKERKIGAVFKTLIFPRAGDVNNKPVVFRPLLAFQKIMKYHEMAHIYQGGLNYELSKMNYVHLIEKLRGATKLTGKEMLEIRDEVDTLYLKTKEDSGKYIKEGFAELIQNKFNENGKRGLRNLIIEKRYKTGEAPWYKEGLEFYEKIESKYGIGGVLFAAASQGIEFSYEKFSEIKGNNYD